jgi:hypothetical protein
MTASDVTVRRVYLAASGILLLFALGLHLAFFLSAGPLVRDEAHEVNFATMDTAGEMVGRLWLDSSPVLYKLYLRAWSVLGESDEVFRASGLLIAVLYLMALVLFFGSSSKNGVPVVTLALPVLSPVVVQQFDALRPYGLGILFTTLFFAFFLDYFRSSRRASFALASLTSVLAVNSMFPACFFVLAACLSAALISVMDQRRRAALLFLLLGVWPFLGVLPYVPVVRKSSYWIVTQQESFPYSTTFGILRQAAGETTVALALALTFMVLAVSFVLERGRAEGTDRSQVLLGLMTLGLFTLLILGSFYGSQILPTTMRYVPVLCLAALCLDVALRPLPLKWRSGAAVTLCLVATVGFAPTFERVTVRQSNVDLVAAKIAEMATADDLVLLHSWSSAISFSRYHHAPTPILTIPDLDQHLVHDYAFLRRKFEDPDPISDVFAALEATLRGGHRVFMIGYFRSGGPTEDIPAITPAPHAEHGWFKVPYLGNFENRVCQFMWRHAERIRTMPAPSVQVDSRVRLPWGVAVGWRDEPLDSPPAGR